MLGQRICEMRTALGWSQVDMAKRLGVAKQTISNWENDNIQPSIEMLVRVAHTLNVSTDYLLGLDDRLQLDVQGLPTEVVGHLILLIHDYREMDQNCNDNATF